MSIEKGKEAAARLAVDENIHTDCIVGIGSGSTITYVLERLVQRCNEKKITVKCIPTSFQSKKLVHDYGLPLTDIDCHPEIDVTIDGADEVDENLVAIKGGGACLTQEKVVACAAKKFVVVADYRKNSRHLGQTWKKGIPIEVLPMACNAVSHRICDLFRIQLEDVVVRIGKEKAGPVITDNGNFVIDWRFDVDETINYTKEDWKAVADKIILIPGVVDVGVFADMVREAYFGDSQGKVTKRGSPGMGLVFT